MTDVSFSTEVAKGLRATLIKIDEMIEALPERRAQLQRQRKGIERKLARLEREIEKSRKAKGVAA